MHQPKREQHAARGGINEFLQDIEPFFYGRRLTYVDVGAFVGKVFKDVLASGLEIREVHLIEPNPTSLGLLRENLKEISSGPAPIVHEVALGAERGRVRLRDSGSMTKVVASSVASPADQAGLFDVECRTLDELSQSFTEKHISLLKIDVEGFEDRVLAGATKLLEEQRVDVVYIEVGVNPAGAQQCYYRHVDDVMLRHGYRLFKVYEQVHEWLDDSPALRRLNLAYFSQRFATSHPFRLTRELFQTRRRLELSEGELTAAQQKAEEHLAELARANERIAALEAELAAKRLELQSLAERHERAGKRRRTLEQQVRTLERRIAELETRTRLVTQERDELSTRLGVLARASQQDALKLARAEARVEALSADRDELRLQRQRAVDERKELAKRLKTLERELARATRAAKSSATASAEDDGSKARLSELERERDELEKQNADLKASQGETERTIRELLRLFEDLCRRERKARAEAALAAEREARTRRHLSYRLGAALVQNAKSPVDWLKMPLALQRAYSEFRQDRAQQPAAPRAQSVDVLTAKDDVTFVLKNDWYTVHLAGTGTAGEVWAHSLSVSSVATAKTELLVDGAQDAPSVSALAGEALDEKRADQFPTMRRLKLKSGHSIRLFAFASAKGTLRIQLRKTAGEPCLVRLQVRSTTSPARTSPAKPDRVEPAEQRDISSSMVAALLSARPLERLKQKANKKGAPHTLFRAQELEREGRPQDALAFALANATDVERPALHLLQANFVGQDDDAWLRHVNAYAQKFGIAPIALRPGSEPRFMRLSAETVRRIEDGPLISVIMPAYNAEKTLELAARSILNQTWRRLELIILDDASSDGTWEIARKIAASDERVKIFRNAANVGPYVSKNVGLRVARGDYVTGHDADDWAHPERLELHLGKMLKAGAKVRASLSGMLRLTADGRFERFARIGPNTTDGALAAGFISCLFEVRFLKEILGGWDSVRFAADSEIIKRAEKVLKTTLPRFELLSMFCLDSPDGLTNHPEYGYSPIYGFSASRKAYRDAFSLWHETIGPENAYLPFPQTKRPFDVPDGVAVDRGSLARLLEHYTPSSSREAGTKPLRPKDVCDVCIVTDLRFPGGNASSTLEEIRRFKAKNLSVLVVHCPSPMTQGKPISERYEGFKDCCEYFYNISEIETDVLLVRHPTVAASTKFKLFSSRIRAKSTAVVINNAVRRPDGTLVYSIDALLENVEAVNSPNKAYYPLGPAIRRELVDLDHRLSRLLAPEDWSPTFDSSQFVFRPKATMRAPFVIGRHARDGAEKWLEDREKLLAAYPDSKEFVIRILGGAAGAVATLGELPKNWEVLSFGSMPPAEYLSNLDVFVYFPHTSLNEAFGRTVMEAIFSGVPCVLPRRFEETFEDMVFYAEPEDVVGVVRRLSLYPEWRLDFLKYARERASLFDSTILDQRLAKLRGEPFANEARSPGKNGSGPSPLSNFSEYKSWVETGHWNVVRDTAAG